ncbi:type II secretion system minor pseudopilin GspJ [Thiohalophilus sp.]|uniref:type II secretion system minor pseudopilin GspJ n=1 Tax=Thiohalophilus sp. TaxID=3028392 RepID=UPI002ACE3098|nr:type II secretion system minor pseudopilin GspJ [Thiohalophilus sp.]MDZ7802472.1 type II secretion system minor pseudopilin GspJ [Thiohalophilus sp.]
MIRPVRTTGFTLLELLVALSIFALVSTMAYGGLQVVLENRSRVIAEGERLGELQLAIGVIERDLLQLAQRHWRDPWGETHPPLSYDLLDMDPRLELVTSGGRPGPQRSRLTRIGYQLEDGVLYRLIWSHLDGSPQEPTYRTRLAGDTEEPRRRFEALEFEFYYRERGVADPAATLTTDSWPLRGQQRINPELLAVELTLELARGGTIQRLFAMPLQPRTRRQASADGQ